MVLAGYDNGGGSSGEQIAERQGSFRGDVFADENNVEQCMCYINQSLVALGFPAPVSLASNDTASLVQTCNSIYAMLQQRQRDIAYREAESEHRQRLMSDYNRLEGKVQRLENQLSAKEREIQTLFSKEQKTAAAHRGQLEKALAERDEFQRATIGAQHTKAQLTHELKKKDMECTKLQERLRDIINERGERTKASMEIVNLLQKEGRQRGTWHGKKGDLEFYKMVVEAYEAKQQNLVAENEDLKASLRSLQVEMRDLLNSQESFVRASNGSLLGLCEPPQTPLGGRMELFDLPYDMARDQIEQSMRMKLASIKMRMQAAEQANKKLSQNPTPTEREKELELRLIEAREIIEEQEKIIQMSLTSTPKYVAPALLERHQEAIAATIAEDKALLEERTAKLDEQRELVQSMAAELDEQRLQIAREKRKLEDERAALTASLNIWGNRAGTAQFLSRTLGPSVNGHEHTSAGMNGAAPLVNGSSNPIAMATDNLRDLRFEKEDVPLAQGA